MKRLVALFSAVVAFAFLFAFLSPGCSNPCDGLADLCGKCGDNTYKQSCLDIVARNVGAVCSGEIATFSSYCVEGQGGGGGGTASTGSGSSGCLPAQSQCLGSCVNVLANAKFCGSCNVACKASELCAAGACVPGPKCPPQLPKQNDDGGCTDSTSDPTCCGDTCQKCTANQACVNGVCADPMTCQGKLCSGSCVMDLSSDPLNCGKCGNVCKSGQVCSAGTCTGSCGAGLTQCCGKCVDITSDPANCNGCNPKCPEAQTMTSTTTGTSGGCAAGFIDCAAQQELCSPCGCVTAAQCTVVSGKTACNGACVDTKSDPKNCGKCGNACAPGLKCSAGMCISGSCQPGKTECAGSCVDVQKDPGNCGSCGKICDVASGSVCDGGYCKSSCTQPKISCGGSCTDIQSDVQNCGDCAKPCAKGQVCSGGKCISNCPTGLTNCNGSCVDISKDFDNCGGCGTSCNDNNVCTFDSCIAAMPAGKCNNESGAVLCTAGNPCITSKCDPIKGCINTPLTPQAIVTGCNLKKAPPPGWSTDDLMNMQQYCLYCDPGKPSDPCQYELRDDQVACTIDTCDPNRFQPVIHTDDNTWCNKNVKPCAQAQCKGAKDPITKKLINPKSDLTSGCVQDDAKCAKPCAPTCNITAANQTVKEGCEIVSPAVCTTTCAPVCSPSDPAIDSKGCVKDDTKCAGSCADKCNPDSASATKTGKTGCVKNSNNCAKTCAPTCDPDSVQAKSANGFGCVLTLPLTCGGMKPVCCPGFTNTADGCSDAADCAM